MQAIKDLADRLDGKPAQRCPNSVSGGPPCLTGLHHWKNCASV
jgi:hypothetical protein